MANVDRPNGLTPVKYLSGAPYTGKVNMYVIDNGNDTATFIGDLVKLAGAGGDATRVNGIDVESYPTVIQAAAGDTAVRARTRFAPGASNWRGIAGTSGA